MHANTGDETMICGDSVLISGEVCLGLRWLYIKQNNEKKIFFPRIQ